MILKRNMSRVQMQFLPNLGTRCATATHAFMFLLLQRNTWQKELKEGRASLARSLRASFYHGGEGMAARTWGNRLGCSHIREAKRDEGWDSVVCPWDAAVHVCARLCTSRVCLVPHLSQSGNSSQACTEVCLLVILDPVTLTVTLSHCPCCAEY